MAKDIDRTTRVARGAGLIGAADLEGLAARKVLSVASARMHSSPDCAALWELFLQIREDLGLNDEGRP